MWLQFHVAFCPEKRFWDNNTSDHAETEISYMKQRYIIMIITTVLNDFKLLINHVNTLFINYVDFLYFSCAMMW